MDGRPAFCSRRRRLTLALLPVAEKQCRRPPSWQRAKTGPDQARRSEAHQSLCFATATTG